MSRPVKPATALQVLRVEQAMRHLAAARELLKEAGAERSVARVRLAITSAGGAHRHVKSRFSRNPSQA
jgi:hypothetical protein